MERFFWSWNVRISDILVIEFARLPDDDGVQFLCSLPTPILCLNPSAGQTMWSDTWTLILPLLSFVSIWPGNQYFSPGEWAKPHSSSTRLGTVKECKVKWLWDSSFLLTLFVVLSAEDTNSRFVWLSHRELTWSVFQTSREVGTLGNPQWLPYVG